jgi:NH3-dependent NAD+ synthetase
MKNEAYTYKTKYGDKTCEAATMFDINKTIMRCLTKNLAMFGLGLYIYAGEDLPEEQKTKEDIKTKPAFGYKELENLKAKKDQYTFDTALKEVQKHYTIDDKMQAEIMALYGATA